MKHQPLSFVFAAMQILLFSCKQETAIEVRETDFLNKAEVTVHGVPVSAQLPFEIHGMVHIDSLNIVVAEGPGGYVFVYSDSWQLLDVFSGQGRARYEFLQSPSMNRSQVFKGADGHILLPLSDPRARLIKLMDITESLANHRTIIADVRDFNFGDEVKVYDNDRKSEIHLRTSFSFLYLDNNIHHTLEITNADFYEILNNPIEYRIRHDFTFIKKPEILSGMEKVVGREYKDNYTRIAHRHPKRNLIIETYYHLNYIAFLDLDNNRSFLIHQAGSPTFKDEADLEKFCFSYTIATDSFFMTFYRGANTTSETISPELMFFDWDGNFIKSVKLDMLTHFNIFDSKTKTVYGIRPLDEEEQLISFDLSPIIDWI